MNIVSVMSWESLVVSPEELWGYPIEKEVVVLMRNTNFRKNPLASGGWMKLAWPELGMTTNCQGMGHGQCSV